MKKRRKEKKHDFLTINMSILISSVLIILSTLIYQFEIAGQTFYLRYIILFLGLMILFDTLSIEFKKQKTISKAFQTIKYLTAIAIIFILFTLIYYILTIPK